MNKKTSHSLTKENLPSHATHPCVLLNDEIEYRNIKQKKLAGEMGIATTVLNEIIHGKRYVTAELAMKLEKALDIDAMVWMRLQAKYEIDDLRINLKKTDFQKIKPMIPYHQTDTRVSAVRESKAKYGSKK